MRNALPLLVLIGACAAPRPATTAAAVEASGLRTVVVTTDKLE